MSVLPGAGARPLNTLGVFPARVQVPAPTPGCTGFARAGGNTDVRPLGVNVAPSPWVPTTGSNYFSRAAGAVPRPQACRKGAFGGDSAGSARRARKKRSTPRPPEGPARHLLFPSAGVRATGPPFGLASGRRGAAEPYCAAQPMAPGLFPSGTRGGPPHLHLQGCPPVRGPGLLSRTTSLPILGPPWCCRGFALAAARRPSG